MRPALLRAVALAPRATAAPRRLCALLLMSAALVGCQRGAPTPKHREPAPERDSGCVDPAKPKAFFYPAENRTDYGPDDPWKDGCTLLVPDHLFCCPAPSMR